MASSMNSEIITLIDSETNKQYDVRLSFEEVERARSDLEFATALLEKVKRNTIKNSSTNITTSTETTLNENKEQHNWSREETLLLIDVYSVREEEFYNKKNTIKFCWEKVSKEMKEKGYDISGTKCSIKFQALKRTYKAIKDHNNRSGNDTKKWEYFELMDRIFNKKPWIKPLAVAGTSVEECDESFESSCTEENEKKSSSRKRKLNMEVYMEKCLNEKIVKRESADKRHNEKMEQLKKIEEILEKAFQK